MRKSQTNHAVFKQNLIKLAPNPYIHFGKKFGRAQAYAASIGGVLTAIATVVTDLVLGPGSKIIKDIIVAGFMPVVEKPALLTHEFKSAFKKFKKTPKKERLKIRTYFFGALKEGWPTLKADILYHDLTYIISLAIMRQFLPDESGATRIILTGLFAILAFLIGFSFATIMGVKDIERQYKKFKKKLSQIGFKKDQYYEIKLLIQPYDKNDMPKQVLKRVQKKFNLKNKQKIKYIDRYFVTTNLSSYNGREPYLRFREKINEKGESKSSLQLIFTKPGEIFRTTRTLFRCYTLEKHKYIYPIITKGKIKNKKVNKLLTKYIPKDSKFRKIKFDRFLLENPKTLFVSTDVTSLKNLDKYWIEIKTRKNLNLLKAANDFIAKEFPVEVTTLNKFELAESE